MTETGKMIYLLPKLDRIIFKIIPKRKIIKSYKIDLKNYVKIQRSERQLELKVLRLYLITF